ncbi:MAG: glycosyltransferase [Armatimonadetes bacterium]|nr:glycosyltransferase [Armatimonadota bacterium]
MKQIAVIIPAFNESERITEVLRAVKGASHISEIIVVNDASEDNTSAVARKVPGIKVIDLVKNVGKGGAMATGVAATSAQIVAFVDADLVGLRAEHVDQIIRPLLRDECDMCFGVFRGGKIRSNAAMAVTPWLSGQRAMKRELFEAIPYIGELRFGVEVAITNTARKKKSRVKRVVLRGVSNCFKEEKYGLVKGLQARSKMYREIREAMVRSRKKDRTQRLRRLTKRDPAETLRELRNKVKRRDDGNHDRR